MKFARSDSKPRQADACRSPFFGVSLRAHGVGDEMAEAAVDSILQSLGGHPVERTRQLGVHLVLRESCGCGYSFGNASRPGSSAGCVDVVCFLRDAADALLARVLEVSGSSRALWSGFVPGLIRALADDLEQEPGSFARYVEQAAERLMARDISLEEVGRALVQLRRSHFQRTG